MNTTIRFPHLGLTLNPGKSFTVFGIEIAYYGVIIALGMLAGALVAYREAKKTGQKVDDYIDFTLYTLIADIIGARIYYVIFEWDYYSAHPLEIFNLRAGGLAIYGGVIASALTLFIFTKVKKLKFWLMADTAVQGLIIGQIIGRWGNFFNCEAFGGFGVQADTADRGAFGLHGAKGVGAVFYVHGKFEGSRIFADSHIFSSFHNLVLFFVFVTRGYSALFSFYFFIMKLSSRSKLRKEACAL